MGLPFVVGALVESGRQSGRKRKERENSKEKYQFRGGEATAAIGKRFRGLTPKEPEVNRWLLLADDCSYEDPVRCVPMLMMHSELLERIWGIAVQEGSMNK